MFLISNSVLLSQYSVKLRSSTNIPEVSKKYLSNVRASLNIGWVSVIEQIEPGLFLPARTY